MFCEHCGRELREGEECQCRKQAPKIKNTMGVSEQKAPSKKEGKFFSINGKVIAAWILILMAIGCFVKLNFFGEDFFNQVKFLNSIKLYFSNGLTLVLLIAGLIVALISMKKKIMRKGYISAISASIVLILGVGAYLGLNIVKNIEGQKLLSMEVSAESIDKLQDYYDGMSSKEDKQEFLKQMRDKVESIKVGYIDEKTDAETAREQLSDLKKFSMIQEDITAAEEVITSVETSREIFQKAEEAEKTTDYMTAVEYYGQVIEEDKTNYEIAQSKVTELTDTYKRDVIEKVNKMTDEGSYAEAMSALAEGMKVLKSDSELISLEGSLRDKYVDSILEQEKTLKEQKKYTEAADLLEQASKLVNSAEFTAELKDLDNYKEVLLNTVKVIDKGKFKLLNTDDIITDTFGNTYSNAYEFYMDGEKGTTSIYFNANEYYKMFSGTFASLESMSLKSGENDNFYSVEIYADDKLIYTSPDLMKTSQPLKFEIDINYAKVIQVKVLFLGDTYVRIAGILGDGKFYN
jgi:tetratricopeptide (TPR) repeat protein